MHSRNCLLSTFAILLLSVGFNHTLLNPTLEDDSEFSKPTIDIGCVVSDIDASIKFYTEAIGFRQLDGFQVDAGYATNVGLTDNKALDVKVLVLGEGKGATHLKLMQVNAKSETASNQHIHSTLGFSYITVHVASTEKALKRLKAAEVETVADSPLPIPNAHQVTLTVIRDPDGNMVELVGPSIAKH